MYLHVQEQVSRYIPAHACMCIVHDCASIYACAFALVHVYMYAGVLITAVEDGPIKGDSNVAPGDMVIYEYMNKHSHINSCKRRMVKRREGELTVISFIGFQGSYEET